jgi:hypothetical protein
MKNKIFILSLTATIVLGLFFILDSSIKAYNAQKSKIGKFELQNNFPKELARSLYNKQ